MSEMLIEARLVFTAESRTQSCGIVLHGVENALLAIDPAGIACAEQAIK